MTGRHAIGAGLVAVGLLLPTLLATSQETASPRALGPRDFARPDAVPFPADNPATPEKIALGAALFTDTRLSRDGSTACATCHNPAQAFTDGTSRGKGIAGVPLKRNTPTLWDLAWGESFFWDGRAASLEAQARGPIEHPLEMDLKVGDAVAHLIGDSQVVAAFASAFPGEGLSESTLLKALSTYERTLISPKTRFDRWVEGDATALNATEIKGFELFVGRAGCAKCHETWRFTDEAYHDIGLPQGSDNGRGDVAGLPRMNNAFKTPTLRELLWTAPYMHDGAIGTLDGANDHYFGGIENRETVSRDLSVFTPVSLGERRQIVAFLKTLSSDTPPQPISLKPVVQAEEPPSEPTAASVVSQREKRFSPNAVKIGNGQPLTILNDDERSHALRIDDAKLKYFSGVQEPGESVVLKFLDAGTYTVTCAIHPKMRLTVTVTKDAVVPEVSRPAP